MAGNNDNPCTVIIHGNITVGVNLMAIEPPDAEYFLRIPFTTYSYTSPGGTGFLYCADIMMPDEETLNNALTFAAGNKILILDGVAGDGTVLVSIDIPSLDPPYYSLNHMGRPWRCCNSTRQPTAEEVAAGWQVVNI